MSGEKDSENVRNSMIVATNCFFIRHNHFCLNKFQEFTLFNKSRSNFSQKKND